MSCLLRILIFIRLFSPVFVALMLTVSCIDSMFCHFVALLMLRCTASLFKSLFVILVRVSEINLERNREVGKVSRKGLVGQVLK